jgi:integrase/recombinase XerC
MARVVGLIPWDLEVEGEKAVAYRDTRGPGLEGVRLLLSGLGDRKKDVRDRAIIRLLYDRGLRRGEAARLDVEDVDLEGYTIAVMGKGRAEKEILTIPEETRDSLAAWIKLLGAASGPLFVNLDRGGRPGGRITGRGIYEVIRQLGARVGVKVRPHGLRHAAITEALNLLPGNTRAVQRFSRHSNLDTVMLYDDNREDLGGKVSRLVAKAAGGA